MSKVSRQQKIEVIRNETREQANTRGRVADILTDLNNLTTDENALNTVNVGAIVTTSNQVILTLSNLGYNEAIIDGVSLKKYTVSEFSYTPVVSTVKILKVYAINDADIFHLAEGVESSEAKDPTIPTNSLLVTTITVTVDGQEVTQNELSSYAKRDGSNLNDVDVVKFRNKLNITDDVIDFASQSEMENPTPPTSETKKVVSLFGLWKWWNKRKVEVTNEIDNKTSNKADKTYVDNGLSLKADKTALTSEVSRLDIRIDGKADASEIGRLDIKINSNIDRLDNRISLKADKTELASEASRLDFKINTNIDRLDNGLSLKADRNGGNLNASDVASFRSKLNNFATQAEMENQTPPISETEKEVSLFGLWKWWAKVKRKVNGITVSDIPNANNNINYGKNLVIRDNGDFGLEDRGTIVNKRDNANVNIWIGSVTQHNNTTPKPSGLVFIHED